LCIYFCFRYIGYSLGCIGSCLSCIRSFLFAVLYVMLWWLAFHFQNVTYKSLDDIYCSKFSTGCNPHVLGWRPQLCVSSLQLDVGYHVVIAAAIPDAMQPVVSHFDSHPLATRPVYMDDNARPHRSRGVTAYLQSEAVTYVPWVTC
jgi:hypothetical protein